MHVITHQRTRSVGMLELGLLALSIAGLMMFPTRAMGQTILNVERGQVEEIRGAHLALEGAAELRAGNEDVINVQGGAVAGYRWDGHWLRLLAGTEYLAEDGDGLLNARHLHLRYNRILGARWRTFHFLQLQANRSLLLDRRLLAGSGVRAAVLRRARHRLDVGTGLMFEDERLDHSMLASPVPAHTRTVRASNLAVYRHEIREGAELLGVTYYQPRIADPGDFRLLQDLVLALALSERLSLELRGEWRHDSRPPPGVEPSDLALRTALTLRLP